jgi:hypothetical protein
LLVSNPRKRAFTGLVPVGLAVLLACACSSATASSAKAPTAQASTTETTCQQVSAVLSDGPDPDADPVGYAEAQILPLRRISAPNPALHADIDQLADAYQQFFASNGKSANARRAVAVASNKLNSICPGAAL